MNGFIQFLIILGVMTEDLETKHPAKKTSTRTFVVIWLIITILAVAVAFAVFTFGQF